MPAAMNIWLQRLLLLIGGLAFGLWLHAEQPSSRFAWNSNNDVLDTKTGQVCVPVGGATTELPRCVDLYKKY